MIQLGFNQLHKWINIEKTPFWCSAIFFHTHLSKIGNCFSVEITLEQNNLAIKMPRITLKVIVAAIIEKEWVLGRTISRNIAHWLFTTREAHKKSAIKARCLMLLPKSTLTQNQLFFSEFNWIKAYSLYLCTQYIMIVVCRTKRVYVCVLLAVSSFCVLFCLLVNMCMCMYISDVCFYMFCVCVCEWCVRVNVRVLCVLLAIHGTIWHS